MYGNHRRESIPDVKSKSFLSSSLGVVMSDDVIDAAVRGFERASGDKPAGPATNCPHETDPQPPPSPTPSIDPLNAHVSHATSHLRPSTATIQKTLGALGVELSDSSSKMIEFGTSITSVAQMRAELQTSRTASGPSLETLPDPPPSAAGQGESLERV